MKIQRSGIVCKFKKYFLTLTSAFRKIFHLEEKSLQLLGKEVEKVNNKITTKEYSMCYGKYK